MKRLNLLLACFFISMGLAIAQNKQVSGTVVDETGEPVIGASVVIKGNATIGTVTDLDGKFTLSVPSAAQTLVVKYLGMQDQEVAVASDVSVILKPSNNSLDEVVVTAYGAITKKTFTGSVSTVSNAKIENKPVATLDQALQGNVAGMVTSSSSGQPGADSKVIIRGRGSINASTDPLYVVDGMPITIGNYSANVGTENGVSPSSAIASLNPNDIESVTVLKDASATSIYGSRAANGVVLITTKKGKSGKPQVSVNLSGGLSSRTNKLKMLNGEQYRELNAEAYRNGGYSEAQIAAEFDRFPKTADGNFYDTNWLNDYAYRDDAKTSAADISINGGTGNTKYYASFSNYSQEAILRWGDMERNSARLNLTHQSTDWLNFGVNATYSNVKQNTPLTTASYYINPAYAAMGLSPLETPYNTDGTFRHSVIGNSGINFVEANTYNSATTSMDRLIGNAFAEVKFLENFRLKTNWGLDNYFIDDDEYNDPRTTGSSAENIGRATKVHQNVKRWTTTNTLSFIKTFDGVHNVNILAGQEAESFNYDYVQAISEQFASYQLRQVESGAEPVTAAGNLESYNMLSYLATASYDYDNKYFASASFRQDGSSKFSANHKWASFWSVGAAWNLVKENFVSDNLPIISALKLRSSYGTSGNSDIGFYNSYGLYDFTAYNGASASYPSQPSNPDLTWESQQLFNVGLDFGLNDGRYGGTLEFYNRRTDDLLLNVPLSGITGFGSQLRNVGSVQNRGFEVTLNAEVVKTKDISWQIDANWSINKNKVLALYDGIDYIDQERKRIIVGEDMSNYWLVRFAGVDPGTGAETWYDREGQLVFQRSYDQHATNGIGSAAPLWQGGLTNTLTAYGFDLSAFFFFNYGNKVYDLGTQTYMQDGARANTNELASQMDRWQKPGDISPNPRRSVGISVQPSTRALYDGSYVRLRNLTLGYTFPSKTLKFIHLDNLRIYAQGLNLLTFTNYPGQDPEVSYAGNYSGVLVSQYPVAKTWMVGLQVKF
jgi:TonB-linked SusC/RagA family outer membrane protein